MTASLTYFLFVLWTQVLNAKMVLLYFVTLLQQNTHSFPCPNKMKKSPSFFNEWKQTSLFICNVCLYEQSNNDIFEVQSIITTHTSGLNFECSISIFSLDASSEKSYHWLKERNMCGNAVNIQYAPLRMENMILK